jgi:hypothetical protein
MMTGFTEDIRAITSVDLEESDEGFTVFAVRVVTKGGIKKTIRFPHHFADFLGGKIALAQRLMDPEKRKASWLASAPSAKDKAELFGVKEEKSA